MEIPYIQDKILTSNLHTSSFANIDFLSVTCTLPSPNIASQFVSRLFCEHMQNFGSDTKPCFTISQAQNEYIISRLFSDILLILISLKLLFRRVKNHLNPLIFYIHLYIFAWCRTQSKPCRTR